MARKRRAIGWGASWFDRDGAGRSRRGTPLAGDENAVGGKAHAVDLPRRGRGVHHDPARLDILGARPLGLGLRQQEGQPGGRHACAQALGHQLAQLADLGAGCPALLRLLQLSVASDRRLRLLLSYRNPLAQPSRELLAAGEVGLQSRDLGSALRQSHLMAGERTGEQARQYECPAATSPGQAPAPIAP